MNPSISRKTLQRFTSLQDFFDIPIGVTSTENLPRVGRSVFLICQIGENEGRFHLLCKAEIAKLLPNNIKKAKRRIAKIKTTILRTSPRKKIFPYPGTTEEQML